MSAANAAMELRGVTKSYGAVRALAGVDLVVPRGSLFGLVGPNGAGKTTLFSVTCGFLRADAGTVSVAGHTVSPRSPPRPGVLAILPQDAGFMPQLPIEQQLAYYAELGGLDRAAARREADRVLALVRLDEGRGRPPDALSHGQRKRVGIAQAFLGNPELIILDEPTAGLDPEVSRDIRRTLREIRSNRTVIVSSHNLAEIEDLCDEVAILAKGRVVRQDRVDALVGAATEIAFRLPSPPPQDLIDALQALPFATDAQWDAGTSRLRVHIDPDRMPPDQAGRDIVGLLVERGVAFVEMHVGTRLEDRYLDETR